MSQTVTFHPTFKTITGGYVPMVTIRGSKGRMVGSVTPKGEGREWRTFDTAAAAECEAHLVALRVAQRLSEAKERIGVRVA